MKKNKIPTIALMYDFDKTLCTTDMQNYELIPNLGVKKDAFWNKATELAENPDAPMDRVLAYMYQILRASKAAERPVRRENFVQFGKSVEFFPGVIEWFARINAYGKSQGVQVEHYILSSGLGGKLLHRRAVKIQRKGAKKRHRTEEIPPGAARFPLFRVPYGSAFGSRENGKNTSQLVRENTKEKVLKSHDFRTFWWRLLDSNQ